MALIVAIALGCSVASCLTARSTNAAPGVPLGRLHFELTGIGGGHGGISGDKIWAQTWWSGSPEGPGPYVGRETGGAEICIWHDLGPTLGAVNSGLAEAGLPVTFWQESDSGAHPGIWGVDQWAQKLRTSASKSDHIDLVACPRGDQVPTNGGAVETDIPSVQPPHGLPLYLWLFWDTVPNPSSGSLPRLISDAFDETALPRPGIGISPSDVGAIDDATVVNLATWLWVNPERWHTYSATASGGGYVATVWAIPTSVHWSAHWDFPVPEDDPEGGVTYEPEDLDESCNGPGVVYDISRPAGQSTYCSFDFTQSTFGTRQWLQAAVSWNVWWAYSSSKGVVGGEGSLGAHLTYGRLPLRVVQVESIIEEG
jgi:hypothetical protein